MASPYYAADINDWKHWLYPLCLFIVSWVLILTGSMAGLPSLLEEIGVWGGILLLCKSSTMLFESETSRPRAVMMILYDLALLGLGITATLMGGPFGLMLGISMIISCLDLVYYAHQLYTMIRYENAQSQPAEAGVGDPLIPAIGMETPHPAVGATHEPTNARAHDGGVNPTYAHSYQTAPEPIASPAPVY